jgi:hypothetical protein
MIRFTTRGKPGSVSTMEKCNMCKKEFDREDVIEEYEYLFGQADALGMESCTEPEQALIEGSICSDCYENDRW